MPDFKRKIPIKPLMVGYLGVLLLWSSYQAASISYFFKGIAVVFFYIALDLIWTYLRDRVWYVPSSSVISGLILGLIGPVEAPLFILFLMPSIAVAAKQLIKLPGSGKHIFNPAGFALIAVSIFGFFPTWWGVSWSISILHAVLIAGLFIWWRQERFETALSFFGSYGLFLATLFLLQGRGFMEIPWLLHPQIFDGTVIFFASVMLIEPLTSSFHGIINRVYYGLIVGAIAALSPFFFGILPLQGSLPIDPLILGLLAGNIIISFKTK